MKKGGLILFELGVLVLVFIIGYLVGAISNMKFNSDYYVRSYVGEEIYMMTNDSGLTKAKVFQQELFEWGKYFYLDNGSQTYALSEEDFMKVWGQQKDLAPKKK